MAAKEAAAASTAALTTRNQRLMLLHRVQCQREQRRLLEMEADRSDLMVGRINALERHVGTQVEAIRRTQAAQGELLEMLIQKLDHVRAASQGT